jgi:hypothetical protein
MLLVLGCLACREVELGKHPSAASETAPSTTVGVDGGPQTATTVDALEPIATRDGSQPRSDTEARAAAATEPTLNDLYAGRAILQLPEEAEEVVLPDAGGKIQIFEFPRSSGKFYALARNLLPQPEERYNIYLYASLDDGKTFRKIGPALARSESFDESFYDPYLTVDDGQDPPLYVMAFECSSLGFDPPSTFADACIATSVNPIDPASWSKPKRFVMGCGADRGGCSEPFRSASTPNVLIDGPRWFLQWTVVSLQDADWNARGTHVYTRAAELPVGLDSPLIYATDGQIIFQAEADTTCTSAWDCNNVNAQDWFREGYYYYSIFNGANYAGCLHQQSVPRGTNAWGLGIARATSPLAPYDKLPEPVIWGRRADMCSASYGQLVGLGGKTYIYYADFDSNYRHTMRRSRLVWGGSHRLKPGYFEAFRLAANESVEFDGMRLLMQTHGNLVLYRGSEVLRASGGSGPAGRDCQGNCFAQFQTQGNLVLYENTPSGPDPYWYNTASTTFGNQLRLSTAYPHISILHAGEGLVWTGERYNDPRTYFTLTAGQSIKQGDLELLMQSQGNLVLYQNGVARWASGAGLPDGGDCLGQCKAVFQSAGNLVLYDASGKAYWSSDTDALPGYQLELHDNYPYISITQNNIVRWKGKESWE